MQDILHVASCCTHLVSFSKQTNVLFIEGRVCSSLRSLFKYLRSHPTRVHVRPYIDELWGIEQHVSKEVVTLLLEIPTLCWTPYAVLKTVTWLRHLENLKHLEVSLDKESSGELVRLLREDHALTNLEALVVTTNYVRDHFWSSLTQTPRLALRSLCVSGFRLEYVPLTSIKNTRFLWISRPYRYLNLHRFLEWVRLDLPHVHYLGTLDFAALGCTAEMDAWMSMFEGSGMPQLKCWNADESGIKDIGLIQKHLQTRSQTVAPLQIQGIPHFKDTEWACGKHRLVSNGRNGLNQYQRYRGLGVLEQDMKTVWIRPSH